jgi:hypothetical protein
MSDNQVDINITTVVNDETLQELNSKLKELVDEDSSINIKVNDNASDELDNFQKKSDDLDGESTNVKMDAYKTEA